MTNLPHEKDSETGIYMSNPVIFADVFNYLIYNGRQVIAAENLRELDRSEFLRPEKEDGETLRNMRDVVKELTVMSDGNLIYAVLGIENQASIDPLIAWRILRYNVERYDKQVRDIKKRNKDEGKFTLTGFTDSDRLRPVVTIVIYWGTEQWNAARTFAEIIDAPPELMAYVPQFKLPIIEPLKMKEKDFDKLASELKTVFRYIKSSTDKKKLRKLMNSDDNLQNMSEDAAYLLRAVTNTKFPIPKNGEGTVNMCKAIEDMLKDSREEGIEQGRKEMRSAIDEMLADSREEGIEQGEKKGRKEGLAAGKDSALLMSIKNLAANMKTSVENAMNLLGIPDADRGRYAAMLAEG